MRLLLCFSLVLFSCASDVVVPKDVMSPNKMETVMYDVIRVDELVDFSISIDSSYRNFSKRTALYDSIFSFHAVSKEDYHRSLQFYQSRPDLLKAILESLQKKTDSTFKPAQAL
jgi:hypothetical protein